MTCIRNFALIMQEEKFTPSEIIPHECFFFFFFFRIRGLFGII